MTASSLKNHVFKIREGAWYRAQYMAPRLHVSSFVRDALAWATATEACALPAIWAATANAKKSGAAQVAQYLDRDAYLGVSVKLSTEDAGRLQQLATVHGSLNKALASVLDDFADAINRTATH